MPRFESKDVECKECSQRFFIVDSCDVNSPFESELHSEWLSVDFKSVKLTWYECPACGARHYVQADDWRTERIEAKCKDVVTRMADKSTHRFDNRRKLSEYLAKLQNDLASSRKRVENEVNGKQIMDFHTMAQHLVVFN